MISKEATPKNNDTSLTVFHYESKEVRTVIINGEVWFVAKDVCEVLELSDVSMATQNLDEDEKGTSKVCTLGGMQDMTVISEAGLYTLLVRSNKEEAKPFRKWVTHEVLPSIRKTGSYLSQRDKAELDRLRQENIRLMSRNQEIQLSNQDLQKSNRALQEQVEQIARLSAEMRRTSYQQRLACRPSTPKPVKQLLAKAQFLSIEDLAKILKAGNPVDAPAVDRNSLFEWLRQYGYLSVDQDTWNQPTNESVRNNWFVVREITLPSTNQMYYKPLCTPAGLEYLLCLQRETGETFTPLTHEQIVALIEQANLNPSNLLDGIIVSAGD